MESNMPVLKVKKLSHFKGSELPKYHSEKASGFDVSFQPKTERAIATLWSNCTEVLTTGLAFDIPEGYELQVRSRSGLASKSVFVVNSPGTIDEDYKGEVKVILHNLGPFPMHIKAGTRIAQLVLVPVTQAEIVEVDELSDSKRGKNGLGSTGV